MSSATLIDVIPQKSSDQVLQEKAKLVNNHKISSESTIHPMQFVVESPRTPQGMPLNITLNKQILTEGANAHLDSSCTLCGGKFVDRMDFNAHIRMHLKEKLHTRREQKQLKEERSSTKLNDEDDQVPTTPLSLCVPLITTFPSLLPSSPLPISKIDLASSEKPDLSVIMNQISPKILVPCGTIPNFVETLTTMNATHSPCSSLAQPSPAPSNNASLCSSELTLASSHVDTAEMSDEELMPYEMDFQNDITFILDQLERDFEASPCGNMVLGNVRLDTPPDSDSENSDYLNRFLEDEPGFPSRSKFLSGMSDPMVLCKEEITMENEQNVNFDLLNVKKVPRKLLVQPQMMLPKSHFKADSFMPSFQINNKARLQYKIELPTIKRPSSMCIDQLVKSKVSNKQASVSKPHSLALSEDIGINTSKRSDLPPRIIDVVKVERSNSSSIGPLPTVGKPYAIINIECRQAGDDGKSLGKLIETYRAIDTGTEIKLLMGNGSMLNDITLDKSSWSIKTKNDKSVTSLPPVSTPQLMSKNLPKSKMSSECSICGKVITTKNMARHMEKHTGKKKFECNVCSATFTQKMHLKNHIILHVTKIKPQENLSKSLADAKQAAAQIKSFSCPSCNRSFVQKGHLNRHIRTVHEVNVETSRLTINSNSLSCRVCQKVCKSKSSLMKHRAKHFACVRCTEIFQNKVSLQDHLLKVHPDSAIVTIERPTSHPSPYLDPDKDLDNAYEEFLDPVIGSIRCSSAFASDLSTVGDSLANIADTNFFNSPEDLDDNFYHSNLF